MTSPPARPPIASSAQGPSPAPTNTCSVQAGQCTKSHALRRRSWPSTSSRHSPESTRKSSCSSSPWYMHDGWPGARIPMLIPTCGKRASPSKRVYAPKSLSRQAASRVSRTNQPSPLGTIPISAGSGFASATMDGNLSGRCRGQPSVRRQRAQRVDGQLPPPRPRDRVVPGQPVERPAAVGPLADGELVQLAVDGGLIEQAAAGVAGPRGDGERRQRLTLGTAGDGDRLPASERSRDDVERRLGPVAIGHRVEEPDHVLRLVAGPRGMLELLPDEGGGPIEPVPARAFPHPRAVRGGGDRRGHVQRR